MPAQVSFFEWVILTHLYFRTSVVLFYNNAGCLFCFRRKLFLPPCIYYTTTTLLALCITFFMGAYDLRWISHIPYLFKARWCSLVPYPTWLANPYSGWIVPNRFMWRSRATFAMIDAAEISAIVPSPRTMNSWLSEMEHIFLPSI